MEGGVCLISSVPLCHAGRESRRGWLLKSLQQAWSTKWPSLRPLPRLRLEYSKQAVAAARPSRSSPRPLKRHIPHLASVSGTRPTQTTRPTTTEPAQSHGASHSDTCQPSPAGT
ncbi:hypothetical protein BU16DRAFT_352284 [Lophium mytilinum]|uniref:Uncharacterized protein n=1 Tax=Lophium mytilinum TaxID=390894 RepID=A0A6A6QYN3_9PEZI|nr:hypothetical protein BU16DRAFT_352284 [Lophium mytilinum]